MNRKRFVLVFTFISVSLIWLIINEINALNRTRKNTTQIINKISKTVFKNDLLENLINKLRTISKENEIELSNFNFVKVQNKTYFKIVTPDLENSSYMIAYEGISVIELYANIGIINEDDIENVEKISTMLIEISDRSITKEEAKRIFAMLSSKLDKDHSSASIAYTNGLTYSLDITEFGGLILSIK